MSPGAHPIYRTVVGQAVLIQKKGGDVAMSPGAHPIYRTVVGQAVLIQKKGGGVAMSPGAIYRTVVSLQYYLALLTPKIER